MVAGGEGVEWSAAGEFQSVSFCSRSDTQPADDVGCTEPYDTHHKNATPHSRIAAPSFSLQLIPTIKTEVHIYATAELIFLNNTQPAADAGCTEPYDTRHKNATPQTRVAAPSISLS